MKNFVENYWQFRLTSLQERLRNNNFHAVIMPSAEEAARYFLRP